MKMHDVTLKLPEPLLAAALQLAKGRDASLAHVLRQALSDEIRRAAHNPKTPNRADEQLLAPLRTLLAVDFGEACSWPDLQSRLRAKGYALREAGGGLALHSDPEGIRMCKASDLGHAYSSLMRRFGKPFPGHAHQHLVERILGTESAPEEEDFDLFEPF